MKPKKKHLKPKKTDCWGTPPEFVNLLEQTLGIKYTLDPCAEPKTAKTKRFFTWQQNGLDQKWTGTVFVNPPYSAIMPWAEKALAELPNCKAITFLVPSNTETKWYRLLFERAARIYFVSPRIQHVAPPSVAHSSNRGVSHVIHMLPHTINHKNETVQCRYLRH